MSNYIPVLIFFIIIIATISLTYLSKILKEKKIISSQDLQFATTILNLSLAIVDQLNLKQEKEIKKVSKMIIDALEFCTINFEGTDMILQNSYQFVVDRCKDMNIEITPERESLIKQLLKLAYENNYMKPKVEKTSTISMTADKITMQVCDSNKITGACVLTQNQLSKEKVDMSKLNIPQR